ncbi:hypothetical protein O0L34_g14897 [Tuta absoluta]|nr:hypothetical protein O0L34_g14897 [Tuta absoluta]
MFCVASCGRVARMAQRVRARSSKISQAPAADSVSRGRAQASAAVASSPLRNLLADASAFGEAAPAGDELQWATQPYAAAPPSARLPPRVEPADTSVLLFPGEGSEHVGMGLQLKDVPAARDLYKLASEVLGWDIWRVCTEGPVEELRRRAGTCVLVTSLAALERARDERPAGVERARAAAGYSVGEIAALVFAGALSLESALRIAELRAAAMAATAAQRAGGMLTVWLTPAAELPHALLRAREHAASKGIQQPVCQIAIYLYPGCKVVAGDEEALTWLERSGARFGLRRTARVAGAGAWHSALMEPARGPLRAALRAVEVAAPRLPVVCGAAGAAYAGGAAHVRRGLERGVARALRWEQALHATFARPRERALPLSLALGPGRALRHTLRQVNARAWDHSLQIDV